mmetsp:Transcript_71247/g.143439  ORF Transcript_71247/g.143439 Transcript_71247/m.143439 type:complete len:247 (-) Transcript_71247:601-1341(-)
MSKKTKKTDKTRKNTQVTTRTRTRTTSNANHQEDEAAARWRCGGGGDGRAQDDGGSGYGGGGRPQCPRPLSLGRNCLDNLVVGLAAGRRILGAGRRELPAGRKRGESGGQTRHRPARQQVRAGAAPHGNSGGVAERRRSWGGSDPFQRHHVHRVRQGQGEVQQGLPHLRPLRPPRHRLPPPAQGPRPPPQSAAGSRPPQLNRPARPPPNWVWAWWGAGLGFYWRGGRRHHDGVVGRSQEQQQARKR